MGSTTLILPVIFQRVGIFTCLIVMGISSLINYKTANLLMIHGKYSDDDLPEMIQRMLGKKFHDLFILSSSSLLFLAASIYYLI
jgi:amino acid permease